MRGALQSNWPSSEIPGPREPAGKASLPYRKYAAAMIMDALNSIANPSHLPALFPQTSHERLEQRRATDRRWLESDREASPLPAYPLTSYVECCAMLGLNHETLRRQIRKRGWLDGTARFDPRVAHRLMDEDAADEDEASG